MKRTLLALITAGTFALSGAAAEQTVTLSNATFKDLKNSYTQQTYTDPTSGLEFEIYATAPKADQMAFAAQKSNEKARGNYITVKNNPNNVTITNVEFKGLVTASTKTTTLKVRKNSAAFNLTLENSGLIMTDPTEGSTAEDIDVTKTAANKSVTVNDTYFLAYNGTNGGQIIFNEIIVTYSESQNPDLKDPGLTVSATSQTDFFAVGSTVPTLFGNPNNLAVTYSSSNEEVAKFDGSELKITGAGKAIISMTFDGNDEYRRQSVSYTLTNGALADNIASFLALAKDDLAKFANPVTVVYVNGKYMFVKDASGSLQLYNAKAEFALPYKPGQTFSGFQAVKGEYNGNPQADVTSTIGTLPAEAQGEETTVDPDIVAPADLSETDYNRYVKFQNISLTKNGKNWYAPENIQLYNRFNIPGILDNANAEGTFNVEGFYVIFNSTKELFITKLEEVIAAPELSIGSDVVTDATYGINEGETVTVTLAAEGSTVYYKWTAAPASGEALRIEATDDFVEYSGSLSIDGAGTLEYYAQKGESKSEIKSITLTVKESETPVLPEIVKSIDPAPGRYQSWAADQKVTVTLDAYAIMNANGKTLVTVTDQNGDSRTVTVEWSPSTLNAISFAPAFEMNKKYTVTVDFNVDGVQVVKDNSGAQITVPAFTFEYTVGTVTGVDEVAADDAEAEYYTISGVRVNGGLTPGIYVKKTGDKVTKVIVR